MAFPPFQPFQLGDGYDLIWVVCNCGLGLSLFSLSFLTASGGSLPWQPLSPACSSLAQGFAGKSISPEF